MFQSGRDPRQVRGTGRGCVTPAGRGWLRWHKAVMAQRQARTRGGGAPSRPEHRPGGPRAPPLSPGEAPPEGPRGQLSAVSRRVGGAAVTGRRGPSRGGAAATPQRPPPTSTFAAVKCSTRSAHAHRPPGRRPGIAIYSKWRHLEIERGGAAPPPLPCSPLSSAPSLPS